MWFPGLFKVWTVCFIPSRSRFELFFFANNTVKLWKALLTTITTPILYMSDRKLYGGRCFENSIQYSRTLQSFAFDQSNSLLSFGIGPKVGWQRPALSMSFSISSCSKKQHHNIEWRQWPHSPSCLLSSQFPFASLLATPLSLQLLLTFYFPAWSIICLSHSLFFLLQALLFT